MPRGRVKQNPLHPELIASKSVRLVDLHYLAGMFDVAGSISCVNGVFTIILQSQDTQLLNHVRSLLGGKLYDSGQWRVTDARQNERQRLERAT